MAHPRHRVIDTTTSTTDDNPFAGPRLEPFGQIFVNMPTDKWLCEKLDKLDVILVAGYPSRSCEDGGLLKDQFVRPARSQSKWSGFTHQQREVV